MISVKNTVKATPCNGGDPQHLIVESYPKNLTSKDRDKIVLSIHDYWKIEVDGYDLMMAIKNAINNGR